MCSKPCVTGQSLLLGQKTLVMTRALLVGNPSIPGKLSCRAGVAQDVQIAWVVQLPRITLETEHPEQPEHPSTRARAVLGGGLWFDA